MRRVEADTLRLLSHMPLLDRLEAVAVSGWSRGAVYRAVESLEREGLAASVPHASELTPATRRYWLTADGLRRLAREEGADVDGLLRSRPVSNQWRRLLMERLDAVGVVYRLASAISTLAHPIRFRWFRAMPMDAAVALPDGRVIAVVRQGPATDRTGFSKRLWRLREGPQPAAALLLMPDEVRLRHARRLLAVAPSIAYLALERDAASAGAGASLWRTPSGAALLDLRTVLDHTGPRGPWPDEEPPARASLPADLDGEAGEDWMLPTMLKPVEKRALDLLSDWPWLTHAHLGALMGLKRSRLSEVLLRLDGLRLIADARIEGRRRLAVTDRGLAMLARRDRASVGAAKRRWSVAPIDADAPVEWRNVSGRRSRQLLRNVEHTVRRPRLHRGPCEAGPLALQGDRPARPAPQGLPLLPIRRPAPLHPPRRLRRPATGRRPLALLPGVGAQGRPPRHDGGAAGPLPALLLVPQANRRPRSAARRAGRLRRRHRPDPLPAHRPRGDGAGRSRGTLCWSPTGSWWSGRGRWDAPGSRRASPNRPTPSGAAETRTPRGEPQP